MNPTPIIPTYHVLLIGIDRYPPRYNSLSGCVNDIDAIERLLLESPGIGVPAEQIHITRLAALQNGRSSSSRLQAETLAPTKANLVQALKALAAPVVKSIDRVLIYYSGHGDEQRWTTSSVWHEALIPHNELDVEYFFDVEINALINAIAARTSDLTVVLDCCHSAGATRDLSGIESQGAVRMLKRDSGPVSPPDLTALGLGADAQSRSLDGHLLQSNNPEYLVVVACQSDEKAGEGPSPNNQPAHGVFTYSLLKALDGKNATQRAALRWADIWPTLLAEVGTRNEALNQRVQHPWLIGRSERKLFGGTWEKMDAGYQVTQGAAGDYAVGVGQLMGVTVGAEIAVYGATPLLFSTIGSPEDQPVGQLRVTQSGPSSAVAVATGGAFVFPDGARGRLVKPGESQRLRVSLKPEDATLRTQLQNSPLLEIVAATAPDADVEVVALPGAGWRIGNDVEPLLAIVPAGEQAALRAGLEHYYRYNTVLRLARNCNDPQLSQSLSVRLLDCTNSVALKAMSPEKLADPDLPEAPRSGDRIYTVPTGFKSCVKVSNSSSYHLSVTLLACSSGGLVQYLSDAMVRDNASHVMWVDGKLGQPFEAWPDEQPANTQGVVRPNFVVDRMIAIGTTKSNVDLRSLTVDKTVQDVVNENLSTRGQKGQLPKKESTAPAELWTATVVPIRIRLA